MCLTTLCPYDSTTAEVDFLNTVHGIPKLLHQTQIPILNFQDESFFLKRWLQTSCNPNGRLRTTETVTFPLNPCLEHYYKHISNGRAGSQNFEKYKYKLETLTYKTNWLLTERDVPSKFRKTEDHQEQWWPQQVHTYNQTMPELVTFSLIRFLEH